MKYLFSVLFCFSLASYSYSQTTQGFATYNQSPFSFSFGLPSNEGGIIQSKGQFLLRFNNSIVSNATIANSNKELVYLDGEMFRSDFMFRYGISKRIEIGADFSYISHSGGFLDRSISAWHKLFNFPGIARELQASNDIEYNFAKGESLFRMATNNSGFGDMRLSTAISLMSKTSSNLAFRGYIKLATGKKENLLGSGTLDYSAQLCFTQILCKKSSASLLISSGILKIGEGGLLPSLQKDIIGFGSITINYPIAKFLNPKIQFDFNTAFFNNANITQMGLSSLQGVFGNDFFLSKSLIISLAFSEDLKPNTAPDFILYSGISYQF